MSEEFNKYSSGKIYKIWSPSREDLVYYGSTIEKLNRRLAGHKCHYKLHKAGKCGNLTSFKIFDECSDYRIDLVESYPCNSREELNAKEGEYIKNNQCVNKFLPCRTNKEYREDNKEKLKEYGKEYRGNNKEKIKEKDKEYRQANKERIKEQKKEYNKQRYEANKEKYEANKDKINAKRRELSKLKKNKE